MPQYIQVPKKEFNDMKKRISNLENKKSKVKTKTKRKPSEYNKFVKSQLKKGKDFKTIAKEWIAKKKV